MKDEARNTGHRLSLWGRETRLRSKPIGFVSAGLIEPLKEEPDDVRDRQTSDGVSEPEVVVEDTIHQPLSTLSAAEGERLNPETAEQQALDSVEPSTSTGPVTTTPITGTSVVDVPQPEGIAFVIDVTGDKSLKAHMTGSPPHIPDPQSAAEESDSSSEVILFKGRANLNRGKEPVEQKHMEQAIALDTIRYEIKAVETEMATDPTRLLDHAIQPSARPRRRDRRPKFKEVDDDEDAIIADYIANMAEDSADGDDCPSRPPFVSRDLGANDVGLGNDTSELSVSSDDSAGSDDCQDGEAGTDGDMVDRKSWEDNDTASPTMDDETLARLLAKQEELGMGSDELLLVSGTASGQGSVYFGRNSQKSGRGKGVNARSQLLFPSANVVADAFDDLDLMDWERPSLRNQRKRGRRAQPPVFGLSDSEMEETLQTAWQKDRESKKSRKIRREELRAQGLLGKHAKPDDPRLRYPTGMSLEDIKTEMRSFLEGTEPRYETGSHYTLIHWLLCFKVTDTWPGSNCLQWTSQRGRLSTSSPASSRSNRNPLVAESNGARHSSGPNTQHAIPRIIWKLPYLHWPEGTSHAWT